MKKKLLALAVATAIAGTTMLGATSAYEVTYHPEANVSYTLNSGFDTEKDFTAGLITITDGTETYTIMDRNLGATAAGTGCEDPNWGNACAGGDPTYGYYFQRGNNYGFPSDPNASITTSNTQVDTNGYGPGNYYSSSTFITASDDRSSVRNDNLRGSVSGTYEAMQGPCPEGYHVPSRGEMSRLLIMLGFHEGPMVGGEFGPVAEKLNTELYFPFAGYRSSSSASLGYQGSQGHYGLSTPYNNMVYHLIFVLENVNPGHGNSRSKADSLRCFRNSPYSPSSEDNCPEGQHLATGDVCVTSDLDIVIQATAAEANQTLKINKYFANAYTVDRGDGITGGLTEDTTHTYATAGTYTITLSLAGTASRWTFQNDLFRPLVPINGSTVTGVKIIYMPSLADGFGDSTTIPGNNFFSQFNRNGAIISLPSGSFDTSNIVSVGDEFFTSFNNSGYLISLPDGSFNISNISGVVGDKFFAWFNSDGKITSLPDGSFNTSNITAVGDDFFDAFNQRGAITGLPNGSFDISNISGVVGDNFFGYFNYRGKITSLPNGSFNISNISGVVGDNFFGEFNFGGSLTSLPDGSFDISNITMVGNDFFNRFNEIGQLISLPTGSFNTSNISGVVGDNFFNSFNYEGKLTILPNGSFDILNITSVGSRFFYAFNTMGIITSLPEGSFDTSNITTVGDEYFAYFNMYGGLTSLPDGSFRLSTGLNIVSNDFFFEFNTFGGLVDLPEGSFDTSHIRAVGDKFFQYFNYDGKITSLPSSFTISSVGAAGSGGYVEAFNSSNYTLNKNVSDLVSGVVAPSRDRNTFSDNQPGRCGVDPNWLVTTANACSITYDSNGGSTIANSTQLYTADTTGVVAGSGITTPTRANYAFDGWYNASVGGTKIMTVTFPSMDSGTLYAHWSKIYSITFTDPSGENTEVVWTGEYGTGTSGKVDYPEWTRNGYTLRWSGSIPGTVPAENIVITVIWTVKQSSGGGGGSTLRKDKCPDGDYSDSYYDGICGKNPKDSSAMPQNDTGTTKDDNNNLSDDLEYDTSKFNPKYSDEMNMAYQFAYHYGITTKFPIVNADMNGKLTRIAMAKMLSQYAIKVLGMKPDTTRQKTFSDVSTSLDLKYDNGVTLAYQLGIMGINMPDSRFRPYDYVPRAEFVTALSRMLYKTPDGEYAGTPKYYTNHMNLLERLGILTNTDPKLVEKRGYIMLMLMRSAK